MSLSRETQIVTFLLTCVLVFALAISCNPIASQTTRERPQSDNSEAHTTMGKKKLSKKEIITAANGALRRHGLNPRKYDVFYDEGNARWHRYIREVPALADALKSRLEGHDYQFLEYLSRPPYPGGQMRVMIDRNTGEELWFKAGD
jgi:hypothetical protein